MAIKIVTEILRKIYYFNYYRNFKGEAKNVILSRKGFIIKPKEITFGKNIFIGRGFQISANNLVFGSDIMIGPNLLIECSNHKFDKIGETMFGYSHIKNSKGVIIENDVWMGANVTILDGVTIHEGCIVGACSNVTKSLPPYTVCVGNPCKPIRNRFSEEGLKNHLELLRLKLDQNTI